MGLIQNKFKLYIEYIAYAGRNICETKQTTMEALLGWS